MMLRPVSTSKPSFHPPESLNYHQKARFLVRAGASSSSSTPLGFSPREGLPFGKTLSSLTLSITLVINCCALATEAATIPDSGVDAGSSPLIQSLLEKSKQNKAKYDAERLLHYTDKNFCDYFATDAPNQMLAARRGITPERYAEIKKYVTEHDCPSAKTMD